MHLNKETDENKSSSNLSKKGMVLKKDEVSSKESPVETKKTDEVMKTEEKNIQEPEEVKAEEKNTANEQKKAIVNEKVDENAEESAKSNAPTESPANKNQLFFDSILENEKKWIKKRLEHDICGENALMNESNPCVSFCFWMCSQCTTVEYREPSTTLLMDLEYLQTQCGKKELFMKEGDSEKTRAYTNNIQTANLENVEAEGLDVYALACACRNEIKTNLVFFTATLEDKLVNVYKFEKKTGERNFVVDRAPFLMNYRSVFKLVKNLIRKLDEQGSVTAGKSIELWADVICKMDLPRDKRMELLTDLLTVEFDYIDKGLYEEIK